MVSITSGYTRKCKDSIGGVSEIYLFKYLPYSRSQIVTVGNKLTSFPETTIYQFEVVNETNANETQEENDGGKYFNQTIDLAFNSAEVGEIEKLQTLDYRIIFKDRNGLYRIFGLYNGMQSGDIKYTTGNAKTDLNGLSINFDGLEDKQSFFIDNLEDTGFIPFTGFLLQENGFFILQENLFKIIL